LTFSSFFPADVVVVPGKKKPNPKKNPKKESACGQCLRYMFQLSISEYLNKHAVIPLVTAAAAAAAIAAVGGGGGYGGRSSIAIASLRTATA